MASPAMDSTLGALSRPPRHSASPSKTPLALRRIPTSSSNHQMFILALFPWNRPSIPPSTSFASLPCSCKNLGFPLAVSFLPYSSVSHRSSPRVSLRRPGSDQSWQPSWRDGASYSQSFRPPSAYSPHISPAQTSNPKPMPPDGFENVGVFWDLENCSIPFSGECAELVRRIRETARQFGTVRFIKAYGKPDVVTARLSDLLVNGVEVIPVASGKEMADKAIITDALLFALDCIDQRPLSDSRGCLIIISGDIGFAPLMSKLSSRRIKTVIISKRRNSGPRGKKGYIPAALSQASDITLDWGEYLEDLDVMDRDEDEEGDSSNGEDRSKSGSNKYFKNTKVKDWEDEEEGITAKSVQSIVEHMLSVERTKTEERAKSETKVRLMEERSQEQRWRKELEGMEQEWKEKVNSLDSKISKIFRRLHGVESSKTGNRDDGKGVEEGTKGEEEHDSSLGLRGVPSEGGMGSERAGEEENSLRCDESEDPDLRVVLSRLKNDFRLVLAYHGSVKVMDFGVVYQKTLGRNLQFPKTRGIKNLKELVNVIRDVVEPSDPWPSSSVSGLVREKLARERTLSLVESDENLRMTALIQSRLRRLTFQILRRLLGSEVHGGVVLDDFARALVRVTDLPLSSLLKRHGYGRDKLPGYSSKYRLVRLLVDMDDIVDLQRKDLDNYELFLAEGAVPDVVQSSWVLENKTFWDGRVYDMPEANEYEEAEKEEWREASKREELHRDEDVSLNGEDEINSFEDSASFLTDIDYENSIDDELNNDESEYDVRIDLKSGILEESVSYMSGSDMNSSSNGVEIGESVEMNVDVDIYCDDECDVHVKTENDNDLELQLNGDLIDKGEEPRESTADYSNSDEVTESEENSDQQDLPTGIDIENGRVQCNENESENVITKALEGEEKNINGTHNFMIFQGNEDGSSEVVENEADGILNVTEVSVDDGKIVNGIESEEWTDKNDDKNDPSKNDEWTGKNDDKNDEYDSNPTPNNGSGWIGAKNTNHLSILENMDLAEEEELKQYLESQPEKKARIQMEVRLLLCSEAFEQEGRTVAAFEKLYLKRFCKNLQSGTGFGSVESLCRAIPQVVHAEILRRKNQLYMRDSPKNRRIVSCIRSGLRRIIYTLLKEREGGMSETELEYGCSNVIGRPLHDILLDYGYGNGEKGLKLMIHDMADLVCRVMKSDGSEILVLQADASDPASTDGLLVPPIEVRNASMPVSSILSALSTFQSVSSTNPSPAMDFSSPFSSPSVSPPTSDSTPTSLTDSSISNASLASSAISSPPRSANDVSEVDLVLNDEKDSSLDSQNAANSIFEVHQGTNEIEVEKIDGENELAKEGIVQEEKDARENVQRVEIDRNPDEREEDERENCRGG